MKRAILANKVRLKLLNKLFLVAAFLLLLNLSLITILEDNILSKSQRNIIIRDNFSTL